MPTQLQYDALHARNSAKYGKQVRKAYLDAISAVSKIAVPLSLNDNKEFYFQTNPDANRKVNAILKTLYNEVYGTTVSGINTEWDLAVEKNNDLAQNIYGKDLKNLPAQYRTKYLSNNAAARQNFVMRKDNGLGLSDKVWNNTKQFKQELELALEAGIGQGKSADFIARNITQYLNDPDKLFRRVRNKENGVLRLSKAAAAYHPGQGRYRSSYKNAFRLTRNETNFSYEGSQFEKRKQQDFIVGIEIKVSPSHVESDDKGGISCTALQGRYPKTFDFTSKWHVNCKCMSLHILKTKAELEADTEKILAGEKPNTPSENAVKGTPQNYNTYLKDNKNKWENWKNPPRTFEANTDIPADKTVSVKPKKAEIDFNTYKDFADPNLYNITSAKEWYLKDWYKQGDAYLEQNKDVKDSLEFYVGNGYKSIRKYVMGKDYGGDRILEKQVNDISTFINENKIKDDLKLYRHTASETVINAVKDLKPGDLYMEVSFSSSATRPQPTFGYYQIVIYAKKGAKVANLHNSSELEYLLQKGSKFKVIKQGYNQTFLQLL